MDKLDYEIIERLGRNARMPLKQIASEIGLTSPAVRSRIEKMEKDGIIRGYHLYIDPRSIGYMITVFISIAVESAYKEEFQAFVRECPNILECHGITGNYFALLKVIFPSTMDLDNFLNRIQKYGETSTNIVLSTYKDSSSVSAGKPDLFLQTKRTNTFREKPSKPLTSPHEI